MKFAVARELRILRQRWREVKLPMPKLRTLKRIVAPNKVKAIEVWSTSVIVEMKDGTKGRISRSLVPSSVEHGDQIIISGRQKEKTSRRKPKARKKVSND